MIISQHTVSNMTMKISVAQLTLGGKPFSRCYKTYLFAMVQLYKTHSLCNITVIRDYNRTVVAIHPPIIQKMHRKIYVRTFFLGLEDFDESWSIAGIDQWRLYLMGLKVTKI